MQQQNTVSDMYNLLGSFMKSYTELMELSAIWLDRSIMINRDNKIENVRRVYHGNLVSLEDGSLVNYKEHSYPHFKVIKCMGNIDSTRLEMELQNLDTQELITIKL